MALRSSSAYPGRSRADRDEGARSRRRPGAEGLIMGVPARFMGPRLVFVACVLGLVAFGLVMVFSSSSILSLISKDAGNNPAYYLTRQAGFALVGIVGAYFFYRVDYRVLVHRIGPAIWMGTVFALFLIFLPVAGQDAYGATRWIAVGPLHFQPSEFAKITVVLAAAELLDELHRSGGRLEGRFLAKAAVVLGVPLLLIVLQPDKGSTMICAVTILVMAYLSGVDWRVCLGVAVLGFAGFLVISLRDSYSRARILTMLDPWRDPYGDGYQLIQGFYAFGSGGLLGVGIGMGRAKYSYLPFPYNDFIFAMVGEECGLVGALGLVAAFALLLWCGYRIARYAPDLTGRLVACGCSTLIFVQMLLNVSGVVGAFPLSGKPVPFVSYGGSSIMASLMLAGLVLSVSRQSRLPLTEHDERRRDWSVTEAPRDPGPTGSFAGEATPRSARSSRADARQRFIVLGGGARGEVSPTRTASRAGSIRATPIGRTGARDRQARGGRGRIDLGPSAGDRLRTNSDGRPDVRGMNGRRGGRGSDGRGR